MTLIKRNLISLVAGFSLLIATGCGNNETGTTPGEDTQANVGEVNVYSSRHYILVGPVLRLTHPIRKMRSHSLSI